MTDSITTRVSRIIAGGAHALIDRAENLAPDAVMAQSLREIEQVIGEVRVDLGKAEAARHLVLSQIARLNAEHETLGEQIEVAVAQARDDLAGAAIGRQADIEDLLPVLQKSLDEQTERSRECEESIIALLAKKRELDQLLADYSAQRAAAGASGTLAGEYGQAQRVAEAENAFGRVLGRQLGSAGLVGGNLAEAAKLRELAELQRGHRIAERLAAIKAARGNGGS